MKKIIEKQIVCVSGQPRSLNHDHRAILSRMLDAEIHSTRIWMKFLWVYELYPLTNQYDSTTDGNKPL
ncbi:MAG: hypothetical protein C0403_06075 [Desulfobacterium sp.]|nr:hypothetical protein [Desulfobacterium sp.]